MITPFPKNGEHLAGNTLGNTCAVIDQLLSVKSGSFAQPFPVPQVFPNRSPSPCPRSPPYRERARGTPEGHTYAGNT
jgi:hypothetical protein